MMKCIMCTCWLGNVLMYSVNIKMNNLHDLYLMYWEERNIFQEVRKFQNKAIIYKILSSNGMANGYGEFK